MKLIWKIFVRDVRQATRNVIAVIVAMGLVIVPAPGTRTATPRP